MSKKVRSNAICFMCVNPDSIICDFLKNNNTHDCFVMIDNNNVDLTTFKKEYQNINFITINENTCRAKGYVNANTWGIKKTPTSWDKIFYYFGLINTSYNHVWIVEEDVFIKNIDAFESIDNKYENTDLLVRHNIKKTNNSTWLYWNYGENKIDAELFHSMVCACRMSKELFTKINNYVEEKNTLFYIEIMINTIANKYNLKIETPIELSTIDSKPEKGKRYRSTDKHGKTDWVSSSLPDSIKPNYMYHPVKNLELHKKWR